MTLTTHQHPGQMLRMSEATHLHTSMVWTHKPLPFLSSSEHTAVRYIRIQKDYQPAQPDASCLILIKTAYSLIGDFIKLIKWVLKQRIQAKISYKYKYIYIYIIQSDTTLYFIKSYLIIIPATCFGLICRAIFRLIYRQVGCTIDAFNLRDLVLQEFVKINEYTVSFISPSGISDPCGTVAEMVTPKGSMSTEGETLQVSVLTYRCSICAPLVTRQMSIL